MRPTDSEISFKLIFEFIEIMNRQRWEARIPYQHRAFQSSGEGPTFDRIVGLDLQHLCIKCSEMYFRIGGSIVLLHLLLS